MKKRAWKYEKKSVAIWGVIIVVVALLLGLVVVGYNYVRENNIYAKILKSNWQVDLPTSYTEVYAIDSGESFLGDGERYHVFEYEDYDDIKGCLEWKTDKNIFVETEVSSLVSRLKASKEHIPNFDSNYKYYTKTEDDSSKLNIILIDDTNIIYIVEEIM